MRMTVEFLFIVIKKHSQFSDRIFEGKNTRGYVQDLSFKLKLSLSLKAVVMCCISLHFLLFPSRPWLPSSTGQSSR